MATSYLKEYLLSQLCKLGIDWPPPKEEEKPVVVQQTLTEAGYTPLLPTDEIPVALLPGMLRLDKQSWLNALSIEATFSSDVEDGDLVYPVAAGVSGEFISNIAELRDAVWKPVNQVSGTASTDEDSPRIWGIAYKHVGRVMFGPVVFHQRFAFKTGDILYVGDSGEITTSNEGAVLGVCLAPGSIFIDLSVTSSKLALDALQERVDKLEQGQEEAGGSISDLTEEIKDIQKELNNKVESGGDISDSGVVSDGTTTNRPLSDRFSDSLNVKDFGAKGDGVADDTAAIQAAIDKMEDGKHSVVFPSGTYLVSSPIVTSAQSSKAGTINLNGSTIKASPNFVGEFVIELGGKDEPCAYDATINITYFTNGVVDGNSVASGIRIQGMHLTTIQDVNVFNATDIGIQIDKSNNTSADAYIKNVMVSGINKVGSRGLFINSFDNEVDGFRSRCFPIGIDDPNGGYLSNCHPIYGLMDDNYNDSIGFKLSGGPKLVDCYADNFAVAFQNDSAYTNVSAVNIHAFWYTNTDNNHIFLKQTNSSVFLWDIYGATYTVPSNGTNKILELPSDLNAYSFESARYGFTGFRVSEGDWQKLSNPYNDWGLALPLYKRNSISLRNNTASANIVTGLWYPLCVVKANRRAIKLNCNISGSVIFDIVAVLNTSSDRFIQSIKAIRNAALADLDIGVAFVTDEGVRYAVLYYRVNSLNGTLNTHTITVDATDLGPYLFYIPRAAYNYDEKCNGLASVDGLVELTHIPGVECAKYNMGYNFPSWGTTHIIPIDAFGLSGYERLSIAIQSNSKLAIWEYYNKTLLKVASDINDESVTISEDNIIVTTTATSIVKVLIV